MMKRTLRIRIKRRSSYMVFVVVDDVLVLDDVDLEALLFTETGNVWK
jgi:hypothetical protein